MRHRRPENIVPFYEAVRTGHCRRHINKIYETVCECFSHTKWSRARKISALIFSRKIPFTTMCLCRRLIERHYFLWNEICIIRELIGEVISGWRKSISRKLCVKMCCSRGGYLCVAMAVCIAKLTWENVMACVWLIIPSKRQRNIKENLGQSRERESWSFNPTS